jgi:F-type H+-transporting ATPase subunit b
MEKLGIQPIQLLAQIFNFLVLLLVLKKFLYKPILNMLDERRKKIEEGLKNADKAALDLEKAKEKTDGIIAEARKDARKILEDAKRIAKKQEDEMLEKAKNEASHILTRAKKEIENEKQSNEKKMRDESIEIASMMIKKLLTEDLSERDHRKIFEQKLKEITKISS